MTVHNRVKRVRPLTHFIYGQTALVCVNGRRVFFMDAEDLPVLDGWTLFLANGYVRLRGTKTEKPTFKTSLARLLMRAPAGTDVDHISGDKLDNRKANLRVCTRSENLRNTSCHSDSQSPFKGCCYCKSKRGPKKWVAHIWCDDRTHHLGYFLTAEDAALAYNDKALKLFGPFARLNVIGSPHKTISATSQETLV
jgi:hypothetical protein